ncbi:MAG: SWIM zinc finger family protein [Deltaproteobacteria bacterium]|jgi:DNA-binding transcriptional regulator YiaG|nr:SWIM zinc finger family protein [Deltaproteobacteria bacterium]
MFSRPSASQKRATVRKSTARYEKTIETFNPISIKGRLIASTFWGKRWCEHFEAMADFSNRLPRGRTYARNGSIMHLELGPGSIHALVAGSDVYEVDIRIKPLDPKRWEGIKHQCHGKISNMFDLLRGHFSQEVMEVVCDRSKGLFPRQDEIDYSCSCPDWAILCKHVAAVFYGIGNRLDTSPELIFTLRQVDPLELMTIKAEEISRFTGGDAVDEIDESLLGDIFGIVLHPDDEPVDGLDAYLGLPPALPSRPDPASGASPSGSGSGIVAPSGARAGTVSPSGSGSGIVAPSGARPGTVAPSGRSSVSAPSASGTGTLSASVAGTPSGSATGARNVSASAGAHPSMPVPSPAVLSNRALMDQRAAAQAALFQGGAGPARQPGPAAPAHAAPSVSGPGHPGPAAALASPGVPGTGHGATRPGYHPGGAAGVSGPAGPPPLPPAPPSPPLARPNAGPPSGVAAPSGPSAPSGPADPRDPRGFAVRPFGKDAAPTPPQNGAPVSPGSPYRPQPDQDQTPNYWRPGFNSRAPEPPSPWKPGANVATSPTDKSWRPGMGSRPDSSWNPGMPTPGTSDLPYVRAPQRGAGRGFKRKDSFRGVKTPIVTYVKRSGPPEGTASGAPPSGSATSGTVRPAGSAHSRTVRPAGAAIPGQGAAAKGLPPSRPGPDPAGTPSPAGPGNVPPLPQAEVPVPDSAALQRIQEAMKSIVVVRPTPGPDSGGTGASGKAASAAAATRSAAAKASAAKSASPVTGPAKAAAPMPAAGRAAAPKHVAGQAAAAKAAASPPAVTPKGSGAKATAARPAGPQAASPRAAASKAASSKPEPSGGAEPEKAEAEAKKPAPHTARKRCKVVLRNDGKMSWNYAPIADFSAITGRDLRRIRTLSELSQLHFATAMGIPPEVYSVWEASGNEPNKVNSPVSDKLELYFSNSFYI